MTVNTGVEQLLAHGGALQWVNTPLLSLCSTLEGPKRTEPQLASVESLNPSFLTPAFKLFNLGKLDSSVLNEPVNTLTRIYSFLHLFSYSVSDNSCEHEGRDCSDVSLSSSTRNANGCQQTPRS